MPSDNRTADSTICIIPVRGGSQGFPRKNLAEILPGRSLLQLTLDQALRCFPNSHVFVSTEDEELAAQTTERGVTLVNRPPHLASSDTTTVAVVRHLFEHLGEKRVRFGSLMILQVTSPLREDCNVLDAIAAIQSGDFDTVTSGYRGPPVHPAKMYIQDSGMFHSVLPEYEAARRQDLPPIVVRNGAIFATTIDFFDRKEKFLGGRMHIVEMSVERSVDIDSPEDLARAQHVMLTK